MGRPTHTMWTTMMMAVTGVKVGKRPMAESGTTTQLITTQTTPYALFSPRRSFGPALRTSAPSVSI